MASEMYPYFEIANLCVRKPHACQELFLFNYLFWCFSQKFEFFTGITYSSSHRQWNLLPCVENVHRAWENSDFPLSLNILCDIVLVKTNDTFYYSKLNHPDYIY